ncbi:uncharacterized protein LOC131239185 isoform X2 [Magnolia sinica]|uniref:uncharacterized protein LOC131239185 isoform X2 n=1 Tax=Magnolia sinica TaxID=86752 RepID=UPI002659BE28|nr:uncharacterized protein LOC131239185 isoform X2 [Magnolia sinica]
MASWVLAPHPPSQVQLFHGRRQRRHHHLRARGSNLRIACCSEDDTGRKPTEPVSIQLYNDIERLVTETAKLSNSNGTWGAATDWSEIEGAWVLKPRKLKPTSVVHFIGGIFVGAAPQLTYRLFLERLSEKGSLVIATPFASGFDHFFIADEVQYKFDRCLRVIQDSVTGLPTFGVGHSLGSLIHLLIGSRYAVQRSGNVLMAFNNKEASEAIPLFSPVIVPMAQGFGPLLSQLTSSPTIRLGAEMAMKQLENLNPTIMKQVLPLVEQLSPLYVDLAKGREDFIPRPEETRRLALPDVPPAMADAVNRGSELLSNLTRGTPWETVGKEVGNTFGTDSTIIRAQLSKDFDLLVDETTSWMSSNSSPRLLQS